MPKRVFWPAALVIMGLIYLASNMGLLPPQFWNFWPLMLIIVGLGGLLISDREDWNTPAAKPQAAAKTKTTGKKTQKKSSRKKSR